MKKQLILLSLLSVSATAHAIPIETDPCVIEKKIITRKESKVPSKPSPIIAWITVRSGPPKPDTPNCESEEVIFDIPDPVVEGPLPYAALPLAPEWEEPVDLYPPVIWNFPRIWFYYGGGIVRVPGPTVYVPGPPSPPVTVYVPVENPPIYPPLTPEPPVTVVPPTIVPPPPLSVPEPGSWGLLLAGLFGFAWFRRTKGRA